MMSEDTRVHPAEISQRLGIKTQLGHLNEMAEGEAIQV